MVLWWLFVINHWSLWQKAKLSEVNKKASKNSIVYTLSAQHSVFNYGKRPSVPEVGSYPGRNPGVALAVASTPAEAREDDDEGDDVEDHCDHCEDQLHLQERERQPHLQPQICVLCTLQRIESVAIYNIVIQIEKLKCLPLFITQKCGSLETIFNNFFRIPKSFVIFPVTIL